MIISRAVIGVLAAVSVFVMAGCSTGKDTATPGASSAATTAPSPTLDAAAAKKTACDAFGVISAESEKEMTAALTTALTAITDSSKEEAAIKGLNQAVANFAQGLETEAAKATHAELKGALAEYATAARKSADAMKAAGDDLEKVMDSIDPDDSFEGLDTKVNEVCKGV